MLKHTVSILGSLVKLCLVHSGAISSRHGSHGEAGILADISAEGSKLFTISKIDKTLIVVIIIISVTNFK